MQHEEMHKSTSTSFSRKAAGDLLLLRGGKTPLQELQCIAELCFQSRSEAKNLFFPIHQLNQSPEPSLLTGVTQTSAILPTCMQPRSGLTWNVASSLFLYQESCTCVLVTSNRAGLLRLRNQMIDLKLLILGEAESSLSMTGSPHQSQRTNGNPLGI